MRCFGLLLATVLGAVPAAAQVPRPTGTVDVTAGPVACDGQECYDMTVSCPEVAAPAKERLKVGGTAEKGTILFASSGFGTDLYEGQGQEKPRILNDLRTAGFQTVQLQWAENWFGGSPGAEEGFVRLACRSATVAQWVHDNVHPPSESAAMCATGHSGGAAQVSYMLSHYGLEDILSLVVPTGGPPMEREPDQRLRMHVIAPTRGNTRQTESFSECRIRPSAWSRARRATVVKGGKAKRDVHKGFRPFGDILEGRIGWISRA